MMLMMMIVMTMTTIVMMMAMMMSLSMWDKSQRVLLIRPQSQHPWPRKPVSLKAWFTHKIFLLALSLTKNRNLDLICLFVADRQSMIVDSMLISNSDHKKKSFSQNSISWPCWFLKTGEGNIFPLCWAIINEICIKLESKWSSSSSSAERSQC